MGLLAMPLFELTRNGPLLEEADNRAGARMNLGEKSRFLARTELSGDAGWPNPILGILAAFYASRLLHNADLSSSGSSLQPSDPPPVPAANRASNDSSAGDDVARGYALDGVSNEAGPLAPTDGSGWDYAVAHDDGLKFNSSQHAIHDLPTGAGSVCAPDLTPIPDLDVPFSYEDAVGIPHGTGSRLGADDNGIHADQSQALGVLDNTLAGTPAFAANAALDFVGFGAVPMDPQPPVAALAAVNNDPATGPSGAHVIDAVNCAPAEMFSSTSTTRASVNLTGANAAQLLQALDGGGLSVNGSGIRVRSAIGQLQ